MKMDIDKQKTIELKKGLLKKFFEIADRRRYSKKRCAAICGVRFLEIYRWRKGESIPRSYAILDRIIRFVKENTETQNSDQTA